ncbi:MAG TPA: Maf family protein, partial [Bacilli bacterium]
DAAAMLARLQGKTHEVFSGVALTEPGTGKTVVSHRVTRVHMKPLNERQIRRYVATGEPLDKAGSYAIQGIGATLIDSIEGCYFNVVGLPLSLLSDMLEQFGLNVLEN